MRSGLCTRNENVQRKRTWKEAAEGAESVTKAGLHPMKVLLCVWWDCKGIIHFELFLRRGETITADKYCEQLTRLDAAIRKKRPVLANRKDIIFHHDNARPHAMGNSPAPTIFSRYCDPSDFHLFRSLQNSLNGENLKSEEAVENYLTNFFQEKPSSFFKNGIDKLVNRWKTIVEKNGDYIIDMINKTVFFKI